MRSKRWRPAAPISPRAFRGSPVDRAARTGGYLTVRERIILVRLAAGGSNRDIAEALAISPATVETHRKNIKKKLGIATTAGLTRYVMENGLSSLDPATGLPITG